MSLSREFHQRIGSSFQSVTEQGGAGESQLSPAGKAAYGMCSRWWGGATLSGFPGCEPALPTRDGCSEHSHEEEASCSHKLSQQTRSHTAPAEGVLKTSSERWQEAEASLSLSWHLMEASRVLTPLTKSRVLSELIIYFRSIDPMVFI